MALWMDAGATPTTEKEKADLEAISALKESTAIEFKEEGNECVRKGKKHYSEAIDCYTKAISQGVLSDSETSILFSNRSHVNLLLGNYRRALTDAEESMRLSPHNVKVAVYRAAKASMSLDLLNEAKSYCEKGIENDPSNEDMKKLLKLVNSKKQEKEQHEAQVSQAVVEAKACLSAIENRGVKIGKAMYRELTGLKKPMLDKNNILHWPVLLLYAEAMTSDFVEDFCETDMFSTHLDMISFCQFPFVSYSCISFR
ncbi:putative tetratricopeptide-like helical domain superfamily [Arabidopsis thaliana]